jgi:hypothetical protein
MGIETKVETKFADTLQAGRLSAVVTRVTREKRCSVAFHRYDEALRCMHDRQPFVADGEFLLLREVELKGNELTVEGVVVEPSL